MKKAKTKSAETQMLTGVELELMSVVWKLGSGTVNDVIASLPQGRELAYTSVSTILRILTKKGFLITQKEGRGHVYIPKTGKPEYEARAVHDVVERVFDGMPVALVRQLLDSAELDENSILELKALIDSHRGKK